MAVFRHLSHSLGIAADPQRNRQGVTARYDGTRGARLVEALILFALNLLATSGANLENMVKKWAHSTIKSSEEQ